MANYDKDAILALHDAGKNPKEIEAELGTSRLVIGQVIKKHRDPSGANKNERKNQTGVTVTAPKEKNNSADKPARATPKKLTAKSAAALWKLLFGIIAMRLGGGWRLRDDEALQLGEATMECLGGVPEPIAAAAASFGGPAVLVATLVTIVGDRMDRAATANGPVIEQERPHAPTPPAQHPRRNVPPPPPNNSNVIDLQQRAGEADNTGEGPQQAGVQLTANTVLRAPSRRGMGVTTVPGLGISG